VSKAENDILKLLKKFNKDRLAREKGLADELKRIYEECRKELYIKFLEAQAGKDTFKLQHIEGTIRDIEKQMKYYTGLTTKARQKSIDESFLVGQEFGANVLAAGEVNISLAGHIGQINRGMVESLMGNIPKLAGKVEQDVLFRIRDELTRGAIMGESIPKIAKRIMGTGLTQEGMKKPFKTLQTRCEVIARTEVIKASDAGYEDLAMKAQGDLGEEIFDAWLTAGDARVDSHCQAIANGTNPTFQSIKDHPGVYKRGQGPRPVINTHPRCRCRRIPYLLSWEKSGEISVGELKGRENNSSAGKPKHKLYVDVPDLSEEAKSGLAKTWDEALQFGKNNNKETLLNIFAKDGTEAFTGLTGNKSSVQFTPELVQFLSLADRDSLISIHNHPSSSSFSAPDLNILSKFDSIKYLTVIGHDETKYLVRVGKGIRPEYNELNQKYSEINRKHYDYFNTKVINGEMTGDQAWKEHTHIINTEIAQEFGWDYMRVMKDEQ